MATMIEFGFQADDFEFVAEEFWSFVAEEFWTVVVVEFGSIMFVEFSTVVAEVLCTAVAFTMSDQRARRVMTSWSRQGDASFARTEMSGDFEARIGLALVLAAGTFSAFVDTFWDATLATSTSIRATMASSAIALQFWATAVVGSVVPPVIATVWRPWQSERWTRSGAGAAVRTFLESLEIIVFETAAGIFELLAPTARSVVRPSSLVPMTRTGSAPPTTAIVVVSFASGVDQIEQENRRRNERTNDDDRFGHGVRGETCPTLSLDS